MTADAPSGDAPARARQPGDRATRHRAVDRSLEILRGMRAVRPEPEPELTPALAAARVAVTDLMLFAGVDPDDARAATREERQAHQGLEVAAPAPDTKHRFRSLGRWLLRWLRQ